MKRLLLALLSAASIVSCSPAEPTADIICTTSVVADAVRCVVPEHVTVESLMGPEIDPHSYKPSQGDVNKLLGAKVVVYNGLHLEGKMTEILEKITLQKPVYAMAHGMLEEDKIEVGPGVYDPHIWFDLSLWSTQVIGLGNFMQKAMPKDAPEIAEKSAGYAVKLMEEHTAFLTAMSAVDSNSRVMITAHDAFSYFGRAYGIEVRGLQGVSTVAEFGVKDVADLAQFIIDRNVQTIFTETSVNAKSMDALREAVAGKGGSVTLGEPLYSDALGEGGTPEATLIGAFKFNTTQILKSLSHE